MKVCYCTLPLYNKRACEDCSGSQDIVIIESTPDGGVDPRFFEEEHNLRGMRIKMGDGSNPRLTEEERNLWLQDWPPETD